jgi:hypothetical protein
MTKKKVEPKRNWVSPGGPPASSKTGVGQAKQREKILARRRRSEQAASKRAADHLGLSGDRVLDFRNALADKLSFYWIELDRCAAAPPSPEQIRIELRELVEGLAMVYRSVHRMSEPVRQALLSECLSLKLGPVKPLIEKLVHQLHQFHAMGESALDKVEVRPGPNTDEPLKILIDVLANLYEEFSGKQLHANDYKQDPRFTGEVGAESDLPFTGDGHLFVSQCLCWLEVNANAGTIANVLRQIVEGRRGSKKRSK